MEEGVTQLLLETLCRFMENLRATLGFQAATQRHWRSPGLPSEPALCEPFLADPKFPSTEPNHVPWRHALERNGPALLCSPCSSWTGHWGVNCWFIHWNDQTQLRASLQQESSSQGRFHWNNHELLLELHMSTPRISNTACQSGMPGVGPTFLCLMAMESSWSPKSTCWAPVEAQLPSPPRGAWDEQYWAQNLLMNNNTNPDRWQEIHDIC